MSSQTGALLRLIGNIVVVASVTLFMSFVIIVMVFGWQLNPVISSGMSPTFNEGHMAVVEPVAPRAVGAGDVIIYRSPLDGQLTAHRVVEIVETEHGLFFRTQADNREEPDPYLVFPENVTGRTKFQVPVLGHLVDFARTVPGFVLFSGLPGMVIVALEATRLVCNDVPREKRRRRAEWTTGLKSKHWVG